MIGERGHVTGDTGQVRGRMGWLATSVCVKKESSQNQHILTPTQIQYSPVHVSVEGLLWRRSGCSGR